MHMFFLLCLLAHSPAPSPPSLAFVSAPKSQNNFGSIFYSALVAAAAAAVVVKHFTVTCSAADSLLSSGELNSVQFSQLLTYLSVAQCSAVQHVNIDFTFRFCEKAKQCQPQAETFPLPLRGTYYDAIRVGVQVGFLSE